MPETSTL